MAFPHPLVHRGCVLHVQILLRSRCGSATKLAQVSVSYMESLGHVFSVALKPAGQKKVRSAVGQTLGGCYNPAGL